MKKYFLFAFLLTIGSHSWADISDCIEPLNKIQQVLMFQPPADPGVMHQAMELRQEAERLCLGGQVTEGLAMLEQALALLPPMLPPIEPVQ